MISYGVYRSAALSTEAVPKSVAAKNGAVIAVTGNNEIIVTKDGNRVGGSKVSWVPTAVAIAPNGTDVAIGGEVSIGFLFPDRYDYSRANGVVTA